MALILVAAYVIYPYIAVYRLSVAIGSGDVSAIESKVDWQSLRQGLKDDLIAAVAVRAAKEESASAKAFTLAIGATIIDGMVDGYVSSQAMAALEQHGPPGQPLPIPLNAINTALESLRMNNIEWAFFDGLGAFSVHLRQAGATQGGPALKLRFELSGGYWKLARINFPIGRTVPATGRSTSQPRPLPRFAQD